MENSQSKCGNGVGRIERADNGRFPDVTVDLEGHPGNHGIGILRQQTPGRSADLAGETFLMLRARIGKDSSMARRLSNAKSKGELMDGVDYLGNLKTG